AGYYAVFATCLGILLFDIFLTLALIDRRRARSWVGGGKIVKNDVGEQNRESDRSSGGEQESGISNGSNAKKQRLANGAKAKVHSNPHPNEVSPLLLDSTSQTEKSPKKWFAATRALLASPQILAALYGSFSDCVLTTSLDAVLPRFVQQTFHWTASEAGLIFLAVTLPSLVDPLFGTLCDRYGRRIVALGGFGLAAPSLALLGIVRNAGLSSKIGLVVFLFCLGELFLFICKLLRCTEWLILPWNPVGSGINAFLTSLVTDMSFAVEQLEQENPGLGGGNGVFTEAYALVDITFGLGLVIGPLISGLLYEKTNWGITVGVLAIFCVSGIVPVVRQLNHLKEVERTEAANGRHRYSTLVAHRRQRDLNPRLRTLSPPSNGLRLRSQIPDGSLQTTARETEKDAIRCLSPIRFPNR
ncbi:MAG: hypothetical protein LQ350_008488, partial [Teloschistes chrysophthalmus]